MLLGGRLGSNADEGRDKLRYASASGKYTLNRRFLNEILLESVRMGNAGN